ncbi:hypothetical protein E4K10_30070 [Streptomyces sp. T1317-0309]|nr:hypothetical protein E4K10_30070 [Streptomyces sp. T1317-0309]
MGPQHGWPAVARARHHRHDLHPSDGGSRRYDARAKAALDGLAIRNRLQDDALEDRERGLLARESVLERREYIANIRIAGLAKRLDEAHNDLAQQKAKVESLKADYQEVTTDYNALIEQVLRDGHERFTRHAEGLALLKLPAAVEARRPIQHRRASSSSVVLFQPRQRQESV